MVSLDTSPYARRDVIGNAGDIPSSFPERHRSIPLADESRSWEAFAAPAPTCGITRIPFGVALTDPFAYCGCGTVASLRDRNLGGGGESLESRASGCCSSSESCKLAGMLSG